MSKIKEFLEAVEQNEYAEYSVVDDRVVMITDVDSDPYVICHNSAILMNQQTIDDILIDIGNKNGFTFRSIEYDSANSKRESQNGSKVKIWHIEGFKVTQ